MYFLFISYNKCATLLQDVNNRGNCEVEEVWRIEDIWELSVLLDQLFYKPKTALKYLKNKANYI